MAPGVLGVESAGDGNDVFWGWLDATGRIGVQAGNMAGAKSANPINDGQWHHIALTRDATTGAVQVYVDGVLSGSATSETGVKTTAVPQHRPHRRHRRHADVLRRHARRPAVFNRVLTADEIRSLM